MVAKCASKVCVSKYIESKRLDALTDTWNMGNIHRFDSTQSRLGGLLSCEIGGSSGPCQDPMLPLCDFCTHVMPECK